MVRELVYSLPEGVIIVSGGAQGVDTYAAAAARERGLELIECKPNLKPSMNHFEICKELFARNSQIVELSDECYAFPALDAFNAKRGGTYDTVSKFIRAKKPVCVL